MSKRIEDILKILARHEGGEVNDLDDRGGHTNFGITEATARSFGYTGSMSHLPYELAKEIYIKNYWTPIQGENLPGVIALLVFDYAVHSGTNRAIKDLQRVLNLEKGIKIKTDGIMGSQTLGAINTYLSRYNGLKALIMAYIGIRCAHYTKIIESNETQSKYNRGWFGRLFNNLDWGHYGRD